MDSDSRFREICEEFTRRTGGCVVQQLSFLNNPRIRRIVLADCLSTYSSLPQSLKTLVDKSGNGCDGIVMAP